RRDRRRAARQASFVPPSPRPATAPEAMAGQVVPAAAPAAASSAPLPSSRPHSPSQIGRPSVLSAKAAEEYRYVTLDLRRITVVVGALFAAMLALWVALDVMRVVTV